MYSAGTSGSAGATGVGAAAVVVTASGVDAGDAASLLMAGADVVDPCTVSLLSLLPPALLAMAITAMTMITQNHHFFTSGFLAGGVRSKSYSWFDS